MKIRSSVKKFVLGICVFSICAMIVPIDVFAEETAVKDSSSIITTSNTSTMVSDYNACIAKIKSVYQEKYSDKSGIIPQIINSIVNQEEFKTIYNSNGKVAFRIVEDALRDALDTDCSTRSYSMGRYYLSHTVPAINQYYHTYCGPAATLQALIGNGFLTNTSSNTNRAAVKNLGNTLGTTSSGTYIGNITDHMRTYYSSDTLNYNTKAFTKYSYAKALPYVKESLNNNGAVIMRVDDTSKLSYYNGVSCTHYVTVIEVNYTRSTVKIVDPHYNSKYRGTHTISFVEFENIMNDNGWLSVLTTDQSSSYEYIY